MSVSRAAKLPAEIRIEYPYASNLHDLGKGVSMHYLDVGQGPIVLLLHGNPTWSFYYRNVVNELVAKGFRCIVPDHIGCGLSDKPQDYSYTLERRIADIESLLDHLGIEKFSLVAHDWGGAIGAGVATNRVTGVDKIVLLNTGAFLSKRIPARIAAIKVPVFGEFVIRALNGFARPAVTMAAKIPLKPSVKRGYLFPYRGWKTRVAVWNFVKDIPLRRTHRSWSTLEAIEAKLPDLADKQLLLMWGARDFCFSLHFLRRFQSIFPRAETVVYPDYGHYVIEDAGYDSWQKISAFLLREECL